MSDTLNFDKDELPVLTVIKGGKKHRIFPVDLLCKIQEGIAKRQKKSALTEPEAVGIIRKAAGMKLTPDEAYRLRQAAEELLLRSEAAKKKLLNSLGSSGSTPASAESPASES